MNATTRRIAFKILWMGVLISLLVVYSTADYDFVYRAF